MTTRPTWTQTFLSFAEAAAQRSTCPRAQVGAVFVNDDNQVLAVSYNGAPRGTPHCTEIGCLIEGGHCVRSLHAEANGIAQAARIGVSLRNSMLISTHRPCVRCALLLIQVGIAAVRYHRAYDSDESREHVHGLLLTAGVFVNTITEAS